MFKSAEERAARRERAAEEHAGYFFMITGETSTARVFVSGDNTAVSGVTVGVYLFRNTRLS